MRKQWKLQATLTYTVCICDPFSKYFKYSGELQNINNIINYIYFYFSPRELRGELQLLHYKEDSSLEPSG